MAPPPRTKGQGRPQTDQRSFPLFTDLSGGKRPSRAPGQDQEPWAPQPTPKPSTFDEAFRELGRRKIGGGPKTVGADEITFTGNLGRGLLVLVSRVRPNDPHESFYTSSNHRLRDSWVGSGGHFVDLRVIGPCSDEDLALIQHLAQAVDTRPVQVRRSRSDRPFGRERL